VDANELVAELKQNKEEERMNHDTSGPMHLQTRSNGGKMNQNMSFDPEYNFTSSNIYSFETETRNEHGKIGTETNTVRMEEYL